MSEKNKTVHRLNVLLSAEIYNDLKNIAEEKNTTLTRVIKHAISLEKYFFEAKKSGARITIERGNDLFEVCYFNHY